MPDLRGPEVEVGNMAGELMCIEGDEASQLVGHDLRHVLRE
jgi:hypothetical protein